MGKRVLLLIGLALIAATAAQAAQVSEAQAQNIAARFMQQHGMGAPAATRPAKAPRRNISSTPQLQTDAAYYVFNTSRGKGFVVVSGDDRTEAVLGYSDQGSFNLDSIPDNMRWWLEQYVEEVAMLDAGVVTLEESGDVSYAGSTSVVAPMLTTTWGQGAPFYNDTPVRGSRHCVTGCVATAMAQVMRYHRWPTAATTTIPAYPYNGTTLPALNATTFNWNQMKNYYDRSDTTTTSIAVSRLMRWCGQAVQMDYGVSSSSAFSYPEVFVDYFHYSTKARQIYRCDYSYTQWRDLIRNELVAGRPVIVDGQKQKGGHCFVCDGQDGNEYYHINWGWYGSYDGYFLLTSLNPKGGGIGSATGENGYMIWQRAIIGLEPNNVATTEKNSVTSVTLVEADKTTYTRSSSSDAFVINLTVTHFNSSPVSRTYDLGWGVYKSDGYNLYQYYTNQETNRTLAQDQFVKYTRSMSFGKGFQNGTYYLRPICRESGNATWFPARYSGRRYIKAQISGNTLTLTPVDHGDEEGVTGSISGYGIMKKVGRPLEVTVNLSNSSFNDYVSLYLYANDNLLAANSAVVNQGSSSSMKILYIPKDAGVNNLCITKGSGDTICTGTVNVNPITPSSLTVSYTVPQANSDRVINGNRFYINTSVKNNYTTLYNDYLDAVLCKREGDGSTFNEVATISKNGLIAGSGSVSYSFDFTNLDPGRYFVRIYYYSDTTRYLGAATATYQVGIIGDINSDGNVNTGDVSELFKAILAGSTDSKYDLNGDGSVNTGDVSALYAIIMGMS